MLEYDYFLLLSIDSSGLAMRTEFHHSKNYYLYASHFFALLYWLDCQEKNGGSITITTKVASTFFLAVHSIKNTKHHQSHSLNAALVMHCIGDALIEFPVKNAILYAIPAFLAGHVLYIKHLSAERQSLHEIEFKKRIGLFAFTICSTYITKNIASNTSGALSYAIPIYATALGGMFMCSCLQKRNKKSAALSAFSYVLADVLIAVNKLVSKIPMVSYVTWPSYFLGQTQIVSNAIHTEKNMSTKCIT